jgi:site-specific DNA recombinase
MDNTLSVALYARVSSQRQADEMTICSQVVALRQRIEHDGFVAQEELCFLDEGYSGSTLLRPALERLRDSTHCGAVDRLYVHSPDRLARKYVYQMLLLEEFAREGVQVVFLNHNPQDESAEGALLLQMQGMIAEYERAQILERTRRGRRFAARQGKISVLAHAPYGYRYVPRHLGGGRRDMRL